MQPNTSPMPPTPQPQGPAPVMDVVAPPPPDRSEPAAPPEPSTDKPSKPKKATVEQKVKQPKQPGSGIGAAIFATVVIVLGLAVLATYAYIKTK